MYVIKIVLFELFVILTDFRLSKCADIIHDMCLSCVLPFSKFAHCLKYVDNLWYDPIAALDTQAITTNEQATKYMGRKRVSTKLPDAKLTYNLWVLAIASMSKYIIIVMGTVFYLRPSAIAGPMTKRRHLAKSIHMTTSLLLRTLLPISVYCLVSRMHTCYTDCI